MKKLLLGALVLGALATMVPAHAAPTGCHLLPAIQPDGSPAHDQQCQYFATTTGEYAPLTPNHWSVVVWRKDAKGVEHIAYRDDAEAGAPTAPKELPSIAGDRVVLVLGSDCLPVPACGQAGIFAAYELHP